MTFRGGVVSRDSSSSCSAPTRPCSRAIGAGGKFRWARRSARATILVSRDTLTRECRRVNSSGRLRRRASAQPSWPVSLFTNTTSAAATELEEGRLPIIRFEANQVLHGGAVRAHRRRPGGGHQIAAHRIHLPRGIRVNAVSLGVGQNPVHPPEATRDSATGFLRSGGSAR